MNLRALLVASLLFGGTACLNSYTPPSGGSSASTNGGGDHKPTPSPTPSPSPSSAPDPSPAPSPQPDPSPTPAPSPSPSAAPDVDHCALLSGCCANLDNPDDQDQCDQFAQSLDDKICEGILAALQSQGLCQ